jgi:hypothetical protein
MRFNVRVRSGIVRYARASIPGTVLLLTNFVSLTAAPRTQEPAKSSEPAEMLVTEQGFLAINSPKGWVRTDGPGLANFVPPQEGKGPSPVWIYISSAPIGPNEEAKDLQSYIASDKRAFKQRFKNGIVQEETPLSLPQAKYQAPVVTFQSGEKSNTVEQVVYIGEGARVLTLVLSAIKQAAFEKALPTFRDFASSYRGSITPTSLRIRSDEDYVESARLLSAWEERSGAGRPKSWFISFEVS